MTNWQRWVLCPQIGKYPYSKLHPLWGWVWCTCVHAYSCQVRSKRALPSVLCKISAQVNKTWKSICVHCRDRLWCYLCSQSGINFMYLLFLGVNQGGVSSWMTAKRTNYKQLKPLLTMPVQNINLLLQSLYSDCLRRESNFLDSSLPVTVLCVCVCCIVCVCNCKMVIREPTHK